MSYRYTSHPHFGFDFFKGSGFGNGNVVIGGFGYGLGMGIGAGDGLGVGKEIEVGGVNCFGGSGLGGGGFGDGFGHGFGSGNVAGGFIFAAHFTFFKGICSGTIADPNPAMCVGLQYPLVWPPCETSPPLSLNL